MTSLHHRREQYISPVIVDVIQTRFQVSATRFQVKIDMQPYLALTGTFLPYQYRSTRHKDAPSSGLNDKDSVAAVHRDSLTPRQPAGPRTTARATAADSAPGRSTSPAKDQGPRPALRRHRGHARIDTTPRVVSRHHAPRGRGTMQEVRVSIRLRRRGTPMLRDACRLRHSDPRSGRFSRRGPSPGTPFRRRRSGPS